MRPPSRDPPRGSFSDETTSLNRSGEHGDAKQGSQAGAGGEGLQRIGCMFGGVIDDYKRRMPHYASDISDSFTRKTISGALFMFFATACSTIALGVVIKKATACPANAPAIANCKAGSSYLGVTEYMVMNAVAGMVHALLGCQPLLVLRPTGPVTAFLTLVFNCAVSMNLNFSALLACTGIFIGIYMGIIAAFEISNYTALLTRFIHDIFAFFVCTIYIMDGFMGIKSKFGDDVKGTPATQDHSIAGSLLGLILAAVFLYVAFTLHGMSKSALFNATFNQGCVDYAITIALFICIFVSYMPEGSVFVERLTLPKMVNNSPLTPSLVLADGTQRTWTSQLGAADGKTAFVGAVAAIPITLFFFFDQNVSSLLTQKPDMQLTKGTYYHSSFLWMAIFNFFGPIVGLPFVTGSLPHSPQFVDSLTVTGSHDKKTVFENRVAPFLMYLTILLALVLPVGRSCINMIPNAAVDGILIFVGVAGLPDTQMFQRVMLLFTAPENYPATVLYARAEPNKMHLFTGIQFTAFGLAWLVQGLAMNYKSLSPLGLCFPVIISILVPFRMFAMPMMFSAIDLELLDNEVDMIDEEKEQYVNPMGVKRHRQSVFGTQSKGDAEACSTLVRRISRASAAGTQPGVRRNVM
eukprot:g89.t1